MRNRQLDVADIFGRMRALTSLNPGYSERRMARKTFRERRTEALADLEQARQRLASLEDTAAARVGRLAVRAGLVELELSDEDLTREFCTIASRFRAKPPLDSPPHTPEAGEK
jgi:hypothetical protein